MTVLSNPSFVHNPIEEVRTLLEKTAVFNNAIDVIEGRMVLGRQEACDLYGKVKGLARQLGGAENLLYLGHRVLEIVVNSTVEEIKSESAAVSEEMVQFIQWKLSEALTTHDRSGSGLLDGDRHKLLKTLLDGILYIKDRTIREKLFEEIAYRLVENSGPADRETIVDQKERVNFLRRHNMTNSWLLKEKGWT